jgi:hypothetical protein
MRDQHDGQHHLARSQSRLSLSLLRCALNRTRIGEGPLVPTGGFVPSMTLCRSNLRGWDGINIG